jgi:tricorn protease
MSGYYRFPTIHGETVVFMCEDDLWSVPVEGGMARRLTSNLSVATLPRLSPDGSVIAFTGWEEGPLEVYVMPTPGGEFRRLTYQGANAAVVGWRPDGSSILYASSAGLGEQSFRTTWLWEVSPEGGSPSRLPFGPAVHLAFGPAGAVVLGRHTHDPARWKRYRGGTAGRFWIAREPNGDFTPLTPTDGNLTCPMWIGDRIFFLSDHEGIANLYSCIPSGDDVRRHTHHDEFYCRNASTDGQRIVYHAGADLYVYDVTEDASRPVPVEFRSPRVQRQRKFVDAGRYLNEFGVHPDGHALALTVRGKLFTMANWEGAVLQHGVTDGVRYRLSEWLNDGKRLVTVSDTDGEEAVEVHTRDGSAEPIRFDGLDIGRPTGMAVSPKADQITLTNHRYELLVVDLETRTRRLLDSSAYERIGGLTWSPDGRWLAYSIASTERTRSIKICRVETGETWMVTPPEFSDYGPAWDPEGKFLYFLSCREFNPLYDHVHFDLGFPQAVRPMLVTLRDDLTNPFVPLPRPLTEKKEEKKNDEKPKAQTDADQPAQEEAPAEEAPEAEKEAKEEEKPIEIHFDRIAQRVVVFPYAEGRYGQIAGIEGKVLFTLFPAEPSLRSSGTPPSDEPKGVLHVYDLKEQKKDTIVSGINYFDLSRDGKTLVYRAGNRLRAMKAGDKSDENLAKEGPSRRSGWIDLGRVKASVVPTLEWRQMYREAWRLQRDHFWTEDMSGVDWELVYRRYLPLLERVATRGEFSDLMWEMQGELGTSHCYEFGGDYRPSPSYAQGFLGADFEYDEASGGYRITHIVSGDPWEEAKDSPLNEPGVNVHEGDILLAIGGQRLGADRGPGELLVNLARQEVELTIRGKEDDGSRTITVKALGSEADARYRAWVSRNRRYVHEKTGGKAGYVHIPNMGPWGYAEFHRGYLAELSHPALIVDVRYNGGGHVSPLILEKLARRRVGYDVRRWGTPIPYPYDSVMGPMVAVTNENSGSDGDIFSHCFKLMRLGLLIGKRTWGGVIGISPQSQFVDGGGTTQPEYSFWFQDVGWRVENYGADPDIEVENRPQDYAAERDPQLDRAIEEIVRQMEENPPRLPDFGPRPRLTLPTLSSRE